MAFGIIRKHVDDLRNDLACLWRDMSVTAFLLQIIVVVMDTVVQFDVNACVICRDSEGTDIKLAEVKTEGRSNLIDYSCKRKDVDLFNYLSSNQPVIKLLMLKIRKKKDIICQAKTDTIHSTIQRVCRERQDKWAFEVSGRIETSGDLHAADAVYHKNCYRKFVTPPQKVKPVGRPPHENAAEIFNMICNNFENSDSELLTVDNLIEEMTLLCDDPSDVYSSRYMKSKLYERYGDDLFIADFSNRKNVIRVAACKNCYGEQCDNSEQLTTSQAYDTDFLEDIDVGVYDEENTTLGYDENTIYFDDVTWLNEEIVETGVYFDM
ncbi:hypothetical protein HELRODRAFT_178217 [Helobdella robusta]|uniref:Uncharacterized protein n=1 Tax=Helobdella robusta TaxID=6412 RepID=T1FCY4_HELRO|nr:hypothetical protein HELRODRAFT_178217 [Helobdella robusta]ESN97424.1 hypothetical protein HELRODRAFT_178217 [Helobdella robusta]